MAKGLFGGLFGGQGLQMVGKLTKQNMEKLQASKPHVCNILYTYYPCIDHIHIWLKKG